ncbi:hypothetical protein KOM00_15915 [Geomonas sp. Red69]|uniref:DUF6178 family protein n=1 Tax=Geomonas diazotrophica TaxID=2843197 RepID=UPI001C11753D|nr:DUF6178 family protein [Geomonas diazotrophica]MBU5638215.1 hypothetical protein [Geomonas diazotrophica]
MAEKKQVAVAKLSERDFQALPLQQKQDYLRTVSGKEKMDLIVSDSDARRLAAGLQPQEFFWLMKEVGEADAVDLLRLATAEQGVFIMDTELWDGWTFSEEQACHWLTYFMEGGEARVHELVKHLDFELLQLLLSREIIVGGGIGDQGNDEERQGDYDHTFDDVFMIKFKNPKHSQLIGAFLSVLVKLDNELYTALMEGVKGDVDLELEEQCQRFRTGRLQDLGFPPLEEALSIYARIHPDHFQLQGGKDLAAAGEGGQLIPVFADEGTLLSRALDLAGSDVVLQELNYLVNSALVAEGQAFHEPESMLGVMHRVCGYLNIALEKLAAGDEHKAARILVEEELKRLFQLGYSIVLQLKFAARDTETVDYATGKLLAGVKAKRPRYYRGLDADGVDGYREFRDQEDVRRVSELLAQLQG